MSEINEPLFARIENGQIVEYPVTTEQIRNRKAPLSMFKQVSFIDPKPQVTEFQHLKENVILVNGVVKVTYNVTDMTLQEILNRLHQDHEAQSSDPITVANVPQEVFGRVVFLARKKVGEDLDVFANTRDYDGIVSLCSYATDPDPAHAAEAQRGVELRSQAWASIRDYQMAVATGATPVPRFESEIFAIVPALTWD